MCGIAGVFRFDGLSPSGAILGAQARSLHHRGPDSAGIWSEGPVGLAHTRLSIVDLSEAGNQPMHSADGRVTLIYNGELYNTESLRSTLPAQRWRGHSDTEVLLNVFCAQGPSCFASLEGMFAFAVYNSAANALWLVRDPFGIKPLYFHRNARRLVFASEIKSLFLDPETPRAANANALRQHLLLGYSLDPETAFAGIMRLPAAHALCVRPDGSLSMERYWDERELFERTVPAIYHGLRSSVIKQSVSDVPMGLFLSSGVDSSLIASALPNDGHAGAFAAYNVGLDPDEGRPSEAGQVERAVAQRTAARFGLPFVKIRAEGEAIPSIASMIETVEEPIANPSNALIDRVCAAARERGTKVLLTGHGGDEVFAGYRRHVWARYSPLVAMVHGGSVLRLAAALTGRTTLQRMADSVTPGAAPHPLLSMSSVGWGLVMQRRLCASWFSPEQLSGTVAPVMAMLERWQGHSLLKQLMLLDMHTYLSAQNLVNMDKVSMRHSVEVRLPFLYRPMVAAGLQTADKYLVRHGRNKWLLRRLAREILPRDVWAGKKRGFGPTQVQLLAGPEAMDLLFGSTTAQRGMFEPRELRRLVTRMLHGRSEETALQLYGVVAIEQWLRSFIDRSPSPAVPAQSAAEPSVVGAR
ncbi:MAG: asparagine synthase (glutamine-hydrolyzing) [Gemmatimonadaceae bacterium]